MPFRATVAIIVDVVLGGLLILLSVTHATLVYHKKGVGVGLPQYQVIVPIIIIMVTATGWWLLGRRKTV